MALTNGARRKVVDAYTRMLLSSWGDEDYAARLDRDPVGALAEAGLTLPADSRVTIVRHSSDQIGAEIAEGGGDLEAQLALYETGLQTGEFVFHVPQAPDLDTGELDADDLNSVAAGATYCCCCCPSCSSCTI